MSKKHIVDVIVEQAREVLPALESHPLTETDSLRDLGANSVDRADIIMMTLEKLELTIPLVELAKADNIGELAGLIDQRR